MVLEALWKFLMGNMLTSRLTCKRQLLCAVVPWSVLWAFVYESVL